MLLTPAPQVALSGHEETVSSTGTRHHTPNLYIIQAAVAVRSPQILAQVAESSWEHTKHDNIHVKQMPQHQSHVILFLLFCSLTIV